MMTSQPRKSRPRSLGQAAIVICVTVVFWLCVNLIGREYGLANRWAILTDLIALAGFAWALIVVFWAWRAG